MLRTTRSACSVINITPALSRLIKRKRSQIVFLLKLDGFFFFSRSKNSRRFDGDSSEIFIRSTRAFYKKLANAISPIDESHRFIIKYNISCIVKQNNYYDNSNGCIIRINKSIGTQTTSRASLLTRTDNFICNNLAEGWWVEERSTVVTVATSGVQTDIP